MMGGGLGTKWDRWEVVGRGFGKMENCGNGCRGGRKLKFSKMSGSIFPASGDQKHTFLGYSRTSGKIKKWGSAALAKPLNTPPPAGGAKACLGSVC